MAVKFECGDFALFQETLKKMRDIDDKIIYALNTSIPTESFKGQSSASEKCKELHAKLGTVHADRCKLIKNCIEVTADRVKTLNAQKDNDISVHKNFKSEQRKLRLLQSELNVEDIVKERTNKTFHERCRPYFHANDAL